MAINIARFNALFTASSAQMQQAFRTLQGGTKKLGLSFNRLKSSVSGLGVAITASLGSVATAAAFAKVASNIDRLAKTSSKLGIGTKELAGLQIAASEAGVSSETLDKSLTKLINSISEAAHGTGEARNAFQALGLDVAKLNQLTPDQQLLALSDAFREGALHGDRLAQIVDIVGIRGTEMINVFALGSKKLQEYGSLAERLGVSVSKIDAAKVEALNDQIGRVKIAAQGLLTQVLIRIAPIIEKSVSVMEDGIAGLIERMDELAGAMTRVASTLLFSDRQLSGLELFDKALQSVKFVLDGIAKGLLYLQLGVVNLLEEIEKLLVRLIELGNKFIPIDPQNINKTLSEELTQQRKNLEKLIRDFDNRQIRIKPKFEFDRAALQNELQIPDVKIEPVLEESALTKIANRLKGAFDNAIRDPFRGDLSLPSIGKVKDTISKVFDLANQLQSPQLGFAGFISGGTAEAFSARLRNVGPNSDMVKLQRDLLGESKKQTAVLNKINGKKPEVVDF